MTRELSDTESDMECAIIILDEKSPGSKRVKSKRNNTSREVVTLKGHLPAQARFVAGFIYLLYGGLFSNKFLQ